MNNYDDYDDIRELSVEESNAYDDRTGQPCINSAAIADAGAKALNGPNGKDVCKTVRFTACIAGIFGLAWLYEGGNKA